MADIFDEIAASVVNGSIPVPVATPAPAISPAMAQPDLFDEVAASVVSQPVSDPTSYDLNNVSGQIGKGLTFGFFNEIQGFESAAQNAIADLFGRGNNQGFWENYEAKKQELGARDKAFEAANPYGAMGLQFAGAALPGIASIFTRAAAATPGVASSVMRNLYGAGIKEAPSAFQLAKMGGIAGGLSAAGEGEGLGRLKNAVVGAAIGAPLSAVGGKLIEGATNVIGDTAANQGLLTRLASERGSAFGGDDFVKFAPEDIFLAKQLKNVPASRIATAADDLALAAEEGAPLFLPEAVGSSKVNRNARLIANIEPSMEFSQKAIQERAGGARDRLTGLFDDISPEQNIFGGAKKLTTAAESILDDATKARTQAVEALYTQAREETPFLKSPELFDLIEKDSYLKSAIAEVKKFASTSDLPDNSLQVVGRAKSILGGQIEVAKRAGENSKAKFLKETYDKLNNIIQEEAPKYRQADAIFSEFSDKLSDLEKSKITFLSNLAPEKIDNIGQIFTMSPEVIKDLKVSFEQAGYGDDFQAGVRSYLQNLVDSAPDKNAAKALSKIVDSTKQKAALSAALGENADDVIRKIVREQKIAEGSRKYFEGSSTFGNFEEAKAFDAFAGVLGSLSSGNYLDALKGLFKNELPDDLAQKMAEIYFTTGGGKDALTRIAPLLKQYGQVAQTAAQASAIGSSSASKPIGGEVGELATEMFSKSNKKAPKAKESSVSDPMIELFTKKKVSGKPMEKKEIKPVAVTKQNKDIKPVSLIEQEIDADPYYSALYETESGRNPLAKNPNSSAAGGFQFIKATAKALGLDDPYDLGKSFEAVKKFTDMHRAKFGDNPETLYAAHYMGEPLLKKWQSGKTLSEEDRAIVKSFLEAALPRFRRIYEKRQTTLI